MNDNGQPLLSGLLRWFLFTMVLANTAGFMHIPLLPLYLTELGATVAQVGLVFTLAAIVPLALQILGGWISDSLGRLRTIALGSVGGTLSYFALAFAPTWQWVLLGEALAATAVSLVAPSFGAFIAEQSSEETRGRVYGLSEMIFMTVSVVGPPLGGILAARLGFRMMLQIAGALYAVAAVLRFWMARMVRRTSEADPQPLSLYSLRANLGAMFGMAIAGGLITWIMITDGVRDVAFSLSERLMPLYLQEIGGMTVEQVGWLSAVFGIAMMVITVPAGWLADKRGERVAIISGFGMQFVALMVFVSAESLLGFACAWYLFGTGVGMMTPAYQSLVSKAVPENLRGTAFGLFQTSLGVISLPAPWLGAQLWERASPRLPFIVTACAGLVAMLPVWFKFKLPVQPAAAQELPPEEVRAQSA